MPGRHRGVRVMEASEVRRQAPGEALPRLDARGVTKRFGRLTVLRDVSLRIGGGEVVALVGENGAGKSSLVACLARIIEPEEGEVRLEGTPLPSTPDQVRQAGVEVLWQDHGLCDDLDQVFALADRVVVLRDGRVVADVSPLEVHRDDIVALMSGIEMDSMARRQLQRLRSLVDQLSDVEPTASLPLIVSAMAAALDQEMLCVHLLEPADDMPTAVLRRTAAVGLPAALLEVNDRLAVGVAGGCAGLAAEAAEPVVVEDLASHPGPERYRRAAAASGIRSEWAAPIVGTHGVLGTVSGFATSVGRPEPAQLELARLYLAYVASAIERERLLTELSRRNRILESLRAMLETLVATTATRRRWTHGSVPPPGRSWRARAAEPGSWSPTWRRSPCGTPRVGPCSSPTCPRVIRRRATRSSFSTTPRALSRWRSRVRPSSGPGARPPRCAGPRSSSASSCRRSATSCAPRSPPSRAMPLPCSSPT